MVGVLKNQRFQNRPDRYAAIPGLREGKPARSRPVPPGYFESLGPGQHSKRALPFLPLRENFPGPETGITADIGHWWFGCSMLSASRNTKPGQDSSRGILADRRVAHPMIAEGVRGVNQRPYHSCPHAVKDRQWPRRHNPPGSGIPAGDPIGVFCPVGYSPLSAG